MARRINTIVIPAAGKGTRLLPATRVTAKEMLPVYDTPMLQLAMDEAAATGAARVVIVISPDKLAIRDYLVPPEAQSLQGSDLTSLRRPGAVEVVFAYQNKPLGLGHAIACARPYMLPGPFGVILPDDVILGEPCLAEMALAYNGGHMVAAMEVPANETYRYGIFRELGPADGQRVSASGMVEKPKVGTEPSRLAAVGRYILDPSVFATLDVTRIGAGGEMQLTDAINADAERLALTAFHFSGRRFDCGCLDGLLDAAVARQAQLRQRKHPVSSGPAAYEIWPRQNLLETQNAHS